MKKFHMLLLSATICATTPAFAMDLDLDLDLNKEEAKRLAILQQLTPEEIERFADGELGHILLGHQGKLPGFAAPKIEDKHPSLPAEYFSAPKVASEQDAPSLPAEFFPDLATATPKMEAVPAPLPDYVQILKEEAPTQSIPASSFLPLTLEQLETLKGGFLKTATGDEYALVSGSASLIKAYNYLGQKAFSCSYSDSKFIDIIGKKVETRGEETHYIYTGGNQTIPNPWYPHEATEETMEHMFEPHTIILKKVVSILPARETTTTDAIYTGGGAPITTTPPTYTGGS